MKRVFTASMHHESNSFNPIIAGESEFSVIRGAEIFNRFKENDAATGIIKTLLAAGYEVVPSVFTSAVPNGEVDIDFYNKIKKEIIETAVAENKRQPLDAAALALHGSMYIHGLGDAEGFLLEELRAALPSLGLTIRAERLVRDAGRLYSVLAVRAGAPEALSAGELYCGKYSLLSNDTLFSDILAEQDKRLDIAVRGLERSGRESDRERLNALRLAAADIAEMRRKYHGDGS